MKHRGPEGLPHDPRVDAYIDRAAPFAQPVLRHLRAAVHAAVPDCTEAIKWSMPFFVHRGRILGHMAAFKQHCSFGVWVAGEAVPESQLEKDGMGQFGRITSLADLPAARELKRVIQAAAAAAEATLQRAAPAKAAPKPKRAPPQLPPDLTTALDASEKARTGFAALAPSQQREYVEWVLDAKQEATRLRRIEQTVAQAAEGKPRYWKYVG